MSTLYIDSVPSGAGITIDGEYCGTAPIDVELLPPDGFDAFRSGYLSGGNVSCTWSQLQSKLLSADVSRFWWWLTTPERRSIAEMAITNTLPYGFNRGRQGRADCRGGEGDWGTETCFANMVVRYTKFGEMKPEYHIDDCYWMRPDMGEEHCWRPDGTYYLPCHFVHLRNDDISYSHAMVGLQVDPDMSTLGSWIVFQYNICDIQPGHPQMPFGSHIMIKIIRDMDHSGSWSYPIAEFDV